MLQAEMRVCVTILGIILISCQPQTKRDRAGVGPAPDSTPFPASNERDGQTGTATDWQLNTENWEESLKLQCEQKKLSACSQLAFEAQRQGKLQEAVALFTKACLGDVELPNCNTETLANARSCFEVSKIYESLGRSADAFSYKNCSCARRFKPAC